jgi:hypothetical protein
MYYKNRYYHTELGRFCSRDPIGYEVGFNIYSYVYSSPVIYVDQLGLDGAETLCPDCCNLHLAFQYNPDPGIANPRITNNAAIITDRDAGYNADPKPLAPKPLKFKDQLASVGLFWTNLKAMIDKYAADCPSEKIALILYGHGSRNSGFMYPITKLEQDAGGASGPTVQQNEGGAWPGPDLPATPDRSNFGDALAKVYALHTKACHTSGKDFGDKEFSNILKIPYTGYEGTYKPGVSKPGDAIVPDIKKD